MKKFSIERVRFGYLVALLLAPLALCLAFCGEEEERIAPAPMALVEVSPSYFVLNSICPSHGLTDYSLEKLFATLHEAATDHQVDPELLMAVMAVESRCQAKARSRAGALGLMQLMPATAKWLGVKNPLAVRDNVFGGAKYLSMLLGYFDGNVRLALAAYNSGPGTVRRVKGIPPYPETRNFVKRVLHYYEELEQAVEVESA